MGGSNIWKKEVRDKIRREKKKERCSNGKAEGKSVDDGGREKWENMWMNENKDE